MDLGSRLLVFLQQQGPHAQKHRGYQHPIVACALQYSIVTTLCFTIHDLYFAPDIGVSESSFQTGKSRCIAGFLLVYAIATFLWRLTCSEPATFRNTTMYELCWLCNITLVHGALALMTQRPVLAQAYCIAVGIDQLLWYVDLGGFFLTGEFPVGVAKYLTWKVNAGWKQKVTCTHHLWTIPLLLYATSSYLPLQWNVLFQSYVITVVHSGASRFFIPSHVVATTTVLKKQHQQEAYSPTASIRTASSSLSTSSTSSSPATTPPHSPTFDSAPSSNSSSNRVETPPPFELPSSPKLHTSPTLVKYLNVNVSHEVWKDIDFWFLNINHPDATRYLAQLWFRWSILNTIIFIVLKFATAQLTLWFHQYSNGAMNAS